MERHERTKIQSIGTRATTKVLQLTIYQQPSKVRLQSTNDQLPMYVFAVVFFPVSFRRNCRKKLVRNLYNPSGV